MDNDLYLEILNSAANSFLLQTSDYIFVKDMNLNYLTASETVINLVGIKEIFGKNDFDIFPEELAEKYRKDDLFVLAGNKIDGIIEELPIVDGKRLWAQTWKFPLSNKLGDIIGMYGISRDVTHTINLENEAEIARDYINLINNMPGGVALVHKQNGCLYLDYANDGFYTIHHSSQEKSSKYMGLNLLNNVFEDDKKLLQSEYASVETDENASGNVTYRIIGDDLQPHWINICFSRAYKKHGLQYYYASYTDMDELKNTEDKLRKSRETLKDAIYYSNIQYFTYYPKEKMAEIFVLNKRMQQIDFPRKWDNYPFSFLDYTKVSEEDKRLFINMTDEISGGSDSAACSVKLNISGLAVWNRIVMTSSVKDVNGNTIKAQCYSIDITEQKEAEERLQREKIRLKSSEKNLIDGISFNISTETMIENGSISDKFSATMDMHKFLDVIADSIPQAEDKKLFLETFRPSKLLSAYNSKIYKKKIEYKRYVNKALRSVSTTAEILPDPDCGDIIAFLYTKDINDEIIQRKITKWIFSSNYEAITYYDITADKMYMTSANFAGRDGFSSVTYKTALDSAISEFVLPSEAESAREKLNLRCIISELESNTIYTLYYTSKKSDSVLDGSPQRHMKCDMFYLDNEKEIIVFLNSNVTPIYEHEKENREKMTVALLAAEQASLAKTEFLSRMSHEIRTPMNAIIGLDAIALQEPGLTLSMEDHLQKIGISARFLLSLINDILDMSKIESGKMVLKSEPFDFEEFIDGINTIMYEQCRDNELDYDCVLKTYTENSYIGDRTKLQQVLTNILGNAVKFTPNGGKVHFMISQIMTSKNNAVLRFEISDTGIGIDEKFIPHMFDAFSQENRGRTAVYGGTGLGLSISKNIITLMGGSIRVHSIKNVGTKFTVEVSLKLSEQTSGRRRLLKPEKSLFTLIVDDDVIVCRHTNIILNEAGFKAEWTDSGLSAIQKVKEQYENNNNYDLILLDWMMPGMDGIETASEIRKIVGPDVTIIIMTAFDWANIEKRARAVGVDMFMKKPLFASSVTSAFENVFYKKEQRILPKHQPSFDFTGKRVLLAEDNAINAEIVKKLLELKHCEIDIVTNGAEAIEAFASSSVGYYNIILMDVRMPIMDGLEASRTIRVMKKADSKTVPIIAMTANAFQEDVNMSLESGMNAHLAKPIEPLVFYETIEKFMNYDGKTDYNCQ